MKDETRELQTEFAVIVNKYCRAFAEKHGWKYDPNDWVGGDVGGVIEICDRFFNFDDIRLDIDEDAEVGEIEAWDDYCLELYDIDCNMKQANYNSWLSGFRPYTMEQIADMKERKKKINEMAAELMDMAREGADCCGNCPNGEVQSDGNYVRCRKKGTFHKFGDSACDFA